MAKLAMHLKLEESWRKYSGGKAAAAVASSDAFEDAVAAAAAAAVADTDAEAGREPDDEEPAPVVGADDTFREMSDKIWRSATTSSGSCQRVARRAIISLALSSFGPISPTPPLPSRFLATDV